MLRISLLPWLLALAAAPAAAETLTLSGADADPAHADALVAQRPLAEFLRAFDAQPHAVLRIRHAGGEAGSRRAESLRDWLVALGLPARRIRLVPAAAEDDTLILETDVNGEMHP